MSLETQPGKDVHVWNGEWQERLGLTEEEMDGRGGGDNETATSTPDGSSSRQGEVERCGQSRHQGTSASRWHKVTR